MTINKLTRGLLIAFILMIALSGGGLQRTHGYDITIANANEVTITDVMRVVNMDSYEGWDRCNGCSILSIVCRKNQTGSITQNIRYLLR